MDASAGIHKRWRPPTPPNSRSCVRCCSIIQLVRRHAPATPAGKVDVTAAPITVTAGTSSALPVNLGGLLTIDTALDPFIMEYADGLALSDVAWGELNAGGISQVFRLYDRTLDLEYRTPYLARVQSSNLAFAHRSHAAAGGHRQ